MYQVKQVNNNNSIGVFGLLWIVLIVLKLMEVVTWSWGLVIFWPVVPIVLLVLFLAACAAGLTLWSDCKRADKQFSIRTNY